MLLADLDAASLDAVASVAGLRVTRPGQGGLYLAPCPLCGRERAHRRQRDRRGPVHLRGGWHCYGCGEGGSRADLVLLARAGVRWAEATDEQRRAALGSEAPPRGAPLPPPPPYLSPDDWSALASVCTSARSDPACRAWADRRGLLLGRDLLALPEQPIPGIAGWTLGGDDRSPVWLPTLGFRLLCPLYGADGAPKGGRLRNVRRAPYIKELALPGVCSAGLVYVPWPLRERWMRGDVADRVVALAEGKPDQLALAAAWRDVYVVGYVEGSFGGGWERGCGEQVIHAHQEDEPDAHGRRKSDHYRGLARAAFPGVREIGCSRLYGAGWQEGMDAADAVGRIPALASLNRSG